MEHSYYQDSLINDCLPLVLIPRAGDRVYEQFLLVMVLVVETSQASGPFMVRVWRARVASRVTSRVANRGSTSLSTIPP